MGLRRLATNEAEFKDRLRTLLIRQTLIDDKMLPVYIQMPGDSRMFTKTNRRDNDLGWDVITDDGCSLRNAKSYEVDEILDAIHNDGVNVYACTRWNLGTPIHPVSILHDCHNRGWREEYET